jgi:glycosyltransferase involved in cell wall biosynthesis
MYTLKQLAMECGVSPLVKIEGYVNDVALENWYGACDVLVHPGRHTPDFVEMFGLVLIEAGLRSKPVIASRLGGIPEAVVENKTGILVAPEDERQLANALVRLLENADQSGQATRGVAFYERRHGKKESCAASTSGNKKRQGFTVVGLVLDGLALSQSRILFCNYL